MKKIKIINRKKINKNIIVTVDFGKNHNYGYCMYDNKEIEPVKFENNIDGFEYFYNVILNFSQEIKIDKIIFGSESTGTYGLLLQYFLMDKGIEVVQVNPKHVKKTKETIDNTPNKTDMKDVKVIAELIERGNYLSTILPQGDEAELRHLFHARDRLVEERTSKINLLKDLEFRVFPEFETIFKDFNTKIVLYLLLECALPEELLEQNKMELYEKLKKLSKGQLKKEKFEKLFELAKRSVGIKYGREAIKKEIQLKVKQILDINKYIKELEQDMATMLASSEVAKKLKTIPGINNVIASAIIGEIGDFKNFNNSRELTKLCGLNLYEKSSGQHQGNKRISKMGRSRLRKLLFFATLSLIRNDEAIKKKYNEYLSRGMIKMKAVTAITRKLVRIIFAIVRDNKVYISGYDKSNCKKTA